MPPPAPADPENQPPAAGRRSQSVPGAGDRLPDTRALPSFCRQCRAQLESGVGRAVDAAKAVTAARVAADDAINAADAAVAGGDSEGAPRLLAAADGAMAEVDAALALAEATVEANKRIIDYSDDCLACALSRCRVDMG